MGSYLVGLWGPFQFDLVAALFDGQTAPLSRVIYSMVGLAGLTFLATSLSLGRDVPATAYVPGRSPMATR
jgi:uncharacterized membrane protein YuzA (DUF378 family)